MGLAVSQWQGKTEELVNIHPLDSEEIVEVVLKVWNDIASSSIGSKPFRIGKDIFPKPQIMGFFLHELVPLEFAYRYPKVWRGEKDKSDKDLVCLTETLYSVEIKTSSHKTKIFGNRSYAQKPSVSRKLKSGYSMAINFEKFSKMGRKPEIRRIRFGWLDHDDWIGQMAASGQQAHLLPEAEKYKLKLMYVLE